jgi:hypothetical protein
MSKGFTTNVVWVAVYGTTRKIVVFRRRKHGEAFQKRLNDDGRYCRLERHDLAETETPIL